MRTSDNDGSVSDDDCSVSDNNDIHDHDYYDNNYDNNYDACTSCLSGGGCGSWWGHRVLRCWLSSVLGSLLGGGVCWLV
jgi:hypothetical protein